MASWAMAKSAPSQWSVVFDNTEPAAAITLRRHWGDVDAFAL